MNKTANIYPDISDILSAKEAWRKERAKLSFAEKLDIMDAMRERIQPLAGEREKADRNTR